MSIPKRKIVTLCGPSSLKSHFDAAAKRYTKEGCVVLIPGWYPIFDNDYPTFNQVKQLHQLTIDKINMSQEVHFINPAGMLDEDQTPNEIAYAVREGKRITFLDESFVERSDREIRVFNNLVSYTFKIPGNNDD